MVTKVKDWKVIRSTALFLNHSKQGKPVSHFPHVEGMFEEQLMHVTSTNLFLMNLTGTYMFP